MTKNQGYEIGCYIRVSTEEQAQNLGDTIRIRKSSPLKPSQ